MNNYNVDGPKVGRTLEGAAGRLRARSAYVVYVGLQVDKVGVCQEVEQHFNRMFGH